MSTFVFYSSLNLNMGLLPSSIFSETFPVLPAHFFHHLHSVRLMCVFPITQIAGSLLSAHALFWVPPSLTNDSDDMKPNSKQELTGQENKKSVCNKHPTILVSFSHLVPPHNHPSSPP